MPSCRLAAYPLGINGSGRAETRAKSMRTNNGYAQPSQVVFTQYDHMIEKLSANRSREARPWSSAQPGEK